MPRFFVPEDGFSEKTVTLVGEDARHISYSLRMAVGEEITVCDFSGKEYRCILRAFTPEEVKAEILEVTEGKTESPVDIRLYMAYPKGDKLETVIQKAVELGATRIIPFTSERCVKRPHPEKAEKQGERLSRIAKEAAKQCGRTTLPTVALPITFSQMLAEAEGFRILCYEGDGTESLRCLLEATPTPAVISVVVGSEGGFSLGEALAAKEQGFRLANLGPRILRCETAPDFVLSALCYRYEL